MIYLIYHKFQVGAKKTFSQSQQFTKSLVTACNLDIFGQQMATTQIGLHNRATNAAQGCITNLVTSTSLKRICMVEAQRNIRLLRKVPPDITFRTLR